MDTFGKQKKSGFIACVKKYLYLQTILYCTYGAITIDDMLSHCVIVTSCLYYGLSMLVCSKCFRYKPTGDAAKYEMVQPKYPILNSVAKSLQHLRLPINFNVGDLFPFLLKACPSLKSVGEVNARKGLKMIRDTVGLKGIRDGSLQEHNLACGHCCSVLNMLH